MTQLALSLAHVPALGREDFLIGPSNAEAAALILAWPRWPAPVCVLHGPAGSGKSHLVAAWQGASGARAWPAMAIAEALHSAFTAPGPLAIEDIDCAVLDEAALFHLANLAREHSFALLLTLRAPAASLPVALPDLASRLRAAPGFAIGAPDDALLAGLMVKLSADRQLALPPAVIDYALGRMERSAEAAARFITALDALSLAAKRPPGRAMAAQALASCGEEGSLR